jgi:Zn finger protein HypA/HybF involved in hydrogenase expression
MGAYGAVLKGVVRRELKCKQCGDKFEHFSRSSVQREYCDYCKNKRNRAVSKRWRNKNAS